jgi:cell division septum initiation protein DivIVA
MTGSCVQTEAESLRRQVEDLEVRVKRLEQENADLRAELAAAKETAEQFRVMLRDPVRLKLETAREAFDKTRDLVLRSTISDLGQRLVDIELLARETLKQIA